MPHQDHPSIEPLERVLVVGAGTMGSGIAQVVAEAGLDTVLLDADAASLKRGLAAISARWDRAVSAGRRTSDEVTAFRNQVRGGTAEDAAKADLIIEAIVESLPAKTALFASLASASGPNALLASNTSSISITELGRASGRPDRMVGLHFFNPVPVLPLVEVVRGLETSNHTVSQAMDFVRHIGKTPVEAQDSPGFIANRLLLPMINEAVFTLQEGIASREAVDDVMKLGMSHPIGPLALADLIGLDVCLDIMETLQRDFGDDKYRPAPLLRRMVAAGRLGRKTGRGFYTYE